jgi:uncharacterized coiled-coil protein SlyX
MSNGLNICRRLKQLEDAIAAQRRFINELRSQGLDTEGEQEHLKDLLTDLDRVLLASRVAA